ncbi:hypothetical protein FHS96_005659 [Sphingomonas zeicaulis]
MAACSTIISPEGGRHRSLKTATPSSPDPPAAYGLAYARAFAAEGADIVINGFGKANDIERERAAIESEFGVRALYSSADMTNRRGSPGWSISPQGGAAASTI